MCVHNRLRTCICTQSTGRRARGTAARGYHIESTQGTRTARGWLGRDTVLRAIVCSAGHCASTLPSSRILCVSGRRGEGATAAGGGGIERGVVQKKKTRVVSMAGGRMRLYRPCMQRMAGVQVIMRWWWCCCNAYLCGVCVCGGSVHAAT